MILELVTANNNFAAGVCSCRVSVRSPPALTEEPVYTHTEMPDDIIRLLMSYDRAGSPVVLR